MKELIRRWKAETPKFWKKVRGLSVKVLVGCSAVWLAKETMQWDLPPFVMNIVKYGSLVAIATGVNAQLTEKK